MNTIQNELPILNGTVVPLDDQVFEVVRGGVHLFHESIENGIVVGRRRHLMTVQPGQPIFALRSYSDTVPVRWTVSPIGTASWIAKNLTDEQAGPSRRKWLTKLLESCPAINLEHEAVVTGSAHEVELQAGQIFRLSSNQFGILTLTSGEVRCFSLSLWSVPQQGEKLVDESVQGPLLLTAPFWCVATRTAKLHWLPYAAEWQSSTTYQALSNTHALVCRCIGEEQRQQTLNQERRHQLRDTQLLVRTQATLGAISSAIVSKSNSISDDIDPLLIALRQLEPELGCQFISNELVIPGRLTTLEEIAHLSRVRLRSVLLRSGWRRFDSGPLLGFVGESRIPVAILFRRGSYRILDADGNETKGQWDDLNVEAVSIVRAFPREKLKAAVLARFGIMLIRRDLAPMFLLLIIGALLGLVLPLVTGWIVDMALPQGDVSLLLQLGLMLIAITIAGRLLDVSEGMLALRMQIRVVSGLQSAVWDRLLRLPLTFYQRFSSGDLLNRAMMVTEIGGQLGATTLAALLNSFSGLASLLLLLYLHSGLASIALGIALASAISTIIISLSIRRRALRHEEVDGQLFGFIVGAIQGISKLRIAGAESRLFNAWGKRFAQQLRIRSQIMRLESVSRMIHIALPILGTVSVFVVAIPSVQMNSFGNQFTLGDFLAFSTAFAIFVGSITQIASNIVDLVDVLAKQHLVKELVEEPEEQSAVVRLQGRLNGDIEIRNLSFRYAPDGPLILDRVSIHAAPGQFVAIVGPSGSGKSTLMRLMLGFDRPESGSILFDGHPIEGIDLEMLRQQIGSVMQSGKLAAAPILENIGAGRIIRLEDAWEALEDAGLAADVRAMPMGIHTLVSEGGANLSGGQRQRLMIARAIARRPRILLLDEATSALDNVAQAAVTSAIARRNTTRIVIAHRLSTIRSADYIYVIDRGRVVQEGPPGEIGNLRIDQEPETGKQASDLSCLA